jgi:hypothetical protein
VSNDRLRTHYIVFSERKPWMKIPAITVEYLKAKIVNISKPYLENLVYK